MAFRYRPHLSSGYVWFFSSTPCLSRRYRPKSSRGLLALTNRPTPFGSSYYLLRSCQLIGRTDDATRTNAIASFFAPEAWFRNCSDAADCGSIQLAPTARSPPRGAASPESESACAMARAPPVAFAAKRGPCGVSGLRLRGEA